jgi:hypothetical protein
LVVFVVVVVVVATETVGISGRVRARIREGGSFIMVVGSLKRG